MTLEIVILDVGHGNCAVLRRGNRIFVIDTGPGTALLEYVLENEIEFVDEILISHADTDHIKGVESLLDHDGISISSVRLNSDAAQDSAQWDAMLYSLEDRRSKGAIEFNIQLVDDLELQFFDVTVQVVAPSRYLAGRGPGSTDSKGRRISTNSISAVVRVLTPGRSILFTGDIDEVGLCHLLTNDQDICADVLVFPHHGGNIGAGSNLNSNRSFADRLLSAVDPEIVIFSFSRRRFKNPRPEFIDAVKATQSRKVMCTQMSRRCLDHSPINDAHSTGVYADGKRFGNCCAGSIVFRGSDFEPSIRSHTQFVHSIAPDALCV